MLVSLASNGCFHTRYGLRWKETRGKSLFVALCQIPLVALLPDSLSCPCQIPFAYQFLYYPFFPWLNSEFSDLI